MSKEEKLASLLGNVIDSYSSDEKYLITLAYSENLPQNGDTGSILQYFEAGKLWGIWKDEESKEFNSGKDITIN